MRTRFSSRMVAPLLSAPLALALGCGHPAVEEAAPPAGLPSPTAAGALGEEAAASAPLGPLIRAAAAEFGVPAELLVAIAQTETGLYSVPGLSGDAFEGQPAYGVMALRGERLQRGAALLGIPVEQVQTQPRDNVRAAAALLRAAVAEAGLTSLSASGELAAWAPAVARFCGLLSPAAQYDYVESGVYQVLRRGLPDELARRHGLSLAPHSGLPDGVLPPPPGEALPQVYYSGATWKPAPDSNFTNGRSATVELLVIHTCAGAWSGCWGWLTTPYPSNPYKTSAHYVVKEDGTQIYALVDESDTAHHVGKPWKGLPTNSRSVGIEHAGFSYQGGNVWSAGQVTASAKLSCDIVKRNRIIRDRDHIIGHYQPDPVNRASDPGTDFPWAAYMASINTCVGGGGGGTTGIIVDSNQANNGANARIVTPSSSWKSSTSVSGYWGSGYYVAPTAAVSDATTFEFQLAADGEKEVFAWWTAASDRTTTAPFVLFDAGGTKLATVYKNQQIDGGKWVSLGRYKFTAGWNQVAVSRWTTPGAQVVADAIRVE